MNVETFNSFYKEITTYVPSLNERLDKILKSPVFHVGLSEQSVATFEHENKEAIVSDGKLCLPFPCVRVLDSNIDKQGSKHAWTFFCHEKVFFSHNFILEKNGNLNFFGIAGFTEELINQVFNPDSLGTIGWACYALRPKFIDINKLAEAGKLREDLASACQDIRNKLIEFISIVNCPRHFTTKVSPSNAQGRSVEWVARKSHYIILGPEHAKQVAGGHRGSFNGTITRAMHNRRAHFRRLTSEKFTKKRGLKIWVKSSWVGPTDWNDNQGNAYKIINPNR